MSGRRGAVPSWWRGLGVGILVALGGLGPVVSAGADAPRPRVALVLSGGGAMGLSHIGVIDVLEQMGIPIDIVVGTSIGAMVGGAYASGYSPQDMEDFVSQVDWARAFSETTPINRLAYPNRTDVGRYLLDVPFDFEGVKLKNGLLLGQNITILIDQMTYKTPAQVNFDNLPRRFRAIATDIVSGQEKVFSEGSLSDALRASMNLPAIFAPYAVDGHYYADGGIVDQLPVDVARSLGADIIIAVNFEANGVADAAQIIKNPLASVQRSMDIMVNSNVLRQIGEATVVITPDMTGLSATDFDHWKELIQRGRAAATKMAPQLQRVLGQTGAVGTHPRDPGLYYTAQPNPVVTRLKVDGGTHLDQREARLLFTRFLGRAPSAQEFQEPLDSLLQTGSFDFVKVRNEPIDDKTSVLDIQLVPRTTGIDSFQLGLSYASTYSGSIYSQFNIENQLVLRDLTGPGSRWDIGGGFLDSPEIESSYLQPLGLGLFLRGTFDLIQTSEAIEDYRLSDVAFYRTTIGGALGLSPFPGAMVEAGVEEVNFNDANYGDSGFAGPDRSLPTLVLSEAVDETDQPLFPTDGWSLTTHYRASLPLGASQAFTTLGVSGQVGFSGNTPFSLFLLGRFGTDFPTMNGASSTVPLLYMPTLSDRRMFPGLVNTLDGTANQVGALGLELKVQVDRVMSGLPVPVFVVAQGAVGGVQNSTVLAVPTQGALLWTFAGGLGVRFTPAFGFLVRGGGTLTPTRQAPFCSIDIGSFRP